MKPQFPKTPFTDNWRAKNASAQALGRLGGIARAKSMTKEQLREIALKGVKARLANKNK